MKKLYYAASLLTLASLSVLTGCKKDTTPFPTNPQSNGTYPDLAYTTPWFPTISDADGIFVSAQVTDEKTVVVSPFYNMYEYGMAKIASSTGNFSSLVDGGTVTLNDSVLAKSADLSYLSSISNYTLNLSNTVKWNIAGNGSSMPALTYTLPSTNNPTYLNDVTTWDLKWAPIFPRTLTAGSSTYHTDSLYNVTVQYSIPVKTSNADSVFIYMTDSKGFVYKRTCLPTDTLIAFAPNNFSTANQASYDLPSFKLQINAIKYQDTVISSKKYYFLKMASAIKYYQATK